jgi:hypothetical protein
MKILITLFFLLACFSAIASPYTRFRENGKVGVKGENGKIIIPAEYEELGWSNGQFSVISNVTGYYLNNKWGIINLHNDRVTKSQFDELYPADGDLLIAKKKSVSSNRIAAGCVSLSGKQVLPFEYDGMQVSSLRAIVFTKVGNQYKYGLIDLSNKTLIPQQFQEIASIGSLRYMVKNFEGKIALFTDEGKQITAFIIDSLSTFKEDFTVFYQGTSKGLLDRNGNIKLEAKYRDIDILKKNEIRIKEHDQWVFLNGENKIQRQIAADSLLPIGSNRFKIKTNNQTQLLNSQFDPLTPAVFTDIQNFERGKAIYQLGDLFGVIQSDGKLLVPALYRSIKLATSYIIAKQLDVTGKEVTILFDSAGNRKVNRGYEAIHPLKNELFAVKNQRHWGIINSQGYEVVACSYDSLIQMKDEFVAVKFKGLNGVITIKEEWKVTPRPYAITLLKNARYLEYTESVVNLKQIGGGVIYFTTNRIEVFDDYFLEYLPSGNVWKIDFNGVIVERQFVPSEPTEKIFEESEGLRAIKRNGRYGFIDSKGRLRVANRYEAVKGFSEGYAAVKILGKWGFINKFDNIAIQPVYEDVHPFSRGLALVKQKGLYGVVDAKGKLVLPVRYQKISFLPTGNILFEINQLKGLANHDGRVVMNAKYQLLEDEGNGYFIIGRDGKYGVISSDGLSTIPQYYDYIYFEKSLNQFVALKRSEWTAVKL